ncbi:MAG TPA: response regulator transcription factor [Candidatus Monoglobus merdigallinarum]|uniref:Stage 0 sporulation protein A homolog n=1 Tax=Candidatus Monoglobus merdigallinarum TaxID=2838698 RepID=A0A9D1TMC8_9FIRM|nr:response regulator transcription factor [Candidatus Monoglobus merdigallinarum]
MIYCVEDDSGIRELVVYSLENTGFKAIGFESGKQFFEELEAGRQPDLVLLDIMLPGEDGISILKRLRKEPKTKKLPVILLTAKDTEFDKVVGLDSGADDYVTKPFGIMELISRIKAVLRRVDALKDSGADSEYRIENVVLNTAKHTVEVDEKPVVLTLKEFEVLRLLMQNQGAVMTRDVLLERIWGYDFDGETRTIDVHIRTLRQKLGSGGHLIKTVRGVGYRIE